MKFEISDWVQAKTRNGEFVHGFIESIDGLQGIAKVFVVRSDNEESVGKTTAVLEHWLRELPSAPLEESGAIHNLIDLALMTRDEQWFKELTLQLSAVSKAGGSDKIKPTVYSSSINRLGYPV